MAINSKTKGKEGELEACHFINNLTTLTMRRTAQFNGKELDSKADIVGMPGIHVEVKRVQALNINLAMEQAVRDSSGTSEIPIVMHRKNRTPWLITMEADKWLKLYEAYKEVNKL